MKSLKENKIIIFCILISIFGCKKLIEIDKPIDKIVAKSIFSTNSGSIAAVTGMYELMIKRSWVSGNGSLSTSLGLTADELSNIVSDDRTYTNNYSATNNYGSWFYFYEFIFRANSAIEGLQDSKTIDLDIKKELIAEAKFLRALNYFYLVESYGDIPLFTTSDYAATRVAPRSSKKIVYSQIIKDLTEAQDDLNSDYVGGDVRTKTIERTRPNKDVARALLARVYLYNGEWQNAINESSKVINNTGTYKLDEIDKVFLKNSNEAIWQLQPVINGVNTEDGQVFILDRAPDNFKSYYLSHFLLDAFEKDDERQYKWIGIYIDKNAIPNRIYKFPYKYKIGTTPQPVTEYLMVFRLAEQFLIRSEAKAQLNLIDGNLGAQSDLNKIRMRAGLSEIFPSTQSAMLAAILKERQVELFTELGHRWFDLKRMGKINEVMSMVTPEKGGVWFSYKSLFPIPQKDILTNPSLAGHQNPGY